MKITGMILPLWALCTLCLAACNNGTKSTDDEKVKSTATTATTGQSTYGTVNTWIDDLENFRTALRQNDVVKQKTYFQFPVNADTTQIWDAVYDQIEDGKRPSTLPATFTSSDYDQHHQAIFNNNFVKSLLEVNSEQLHQKGEYTTSTLKNGKESFYMIAHYDQATTTLQLTLSYPGGTDENGDYVSEGEFAIIYFFKVEGNKHLRFDKVLFAG